jgi:hypothetical protein
VLNLERIVSSFGIKIVDLYSVAAPTTARKTRMDQVPATRKKAATDFEADAGRGKCVSRPEICREVTGTFAATQALTPLCAGINNEMVASSSAKEF